MTRHYDYDELESADVDAIYRGAVKKGERQRHYQDPFKPLLGLKSQGGFRWRGKRESTPFMVVYSDFVQAEWPDRIDETTGRVVYYGDNRTPGNDLHEVSGNRWLRDTFCAAQAGARSEVVPTLVFTKGVEGRDCRFRGLAVPEELVAVWRSSEGERFQNYRATFTILDSPSISRVWLEELIAGNPDAVENAPSAWQEWVRTGRPRALAAPPVTGWRTKAAQLPTNPVHMRALEAIHAHYPDKKYAHEFEKVARRLVMDMDQNVHEIDLTRPWRDGGRDGLGVYSVGPSRSAISIEFALEAKCYQPNGKGVGVKEMSRLISRLRHRQFGVLVTTSYVAQQAYEEVTEDDHPVIILAGADIIELLPLQLRNPAAVTKWLQAEFPIPKP